MGQFLLKRVVGFGSVTGNVNTVIAGAQKVVKSATAFTMQDVLIGSLSVDAELLAETNTITLGLAWVVSEDNSTWRDCRDINNTAPTIFGTGTAGADSPVRRVIPAPGSVYAWLYAAVAVLVDVTTGATVDTYTIKFNFRRPDFS